MKNTTKENILRNAFAVFSRKTRTSATICHDVKWKLDSCLFDITNIETDNQATDLVDALKAFPTETLSGLLFKHMDMTVSLTNEGYKIGCVMQWSDEAARLLQQETDVSEEGDAPLQRSASNWQLALFFAALVVCLAILFLK